MQKIDGSLLYSASDLADFLVCRHLIHLKRISLVTYLKKAETDEQVKLLQENGIEHENAFLNSLRNQNKHIAEIKVKGTSRTQQISDNRVNQVREFLNWTLSVRMDANVIGIMIQWIKTGSQQVLLR